MTVDQVSQREGNGVACADLEEGGGCQGVPDPPFTNLNIFKFTKNMPKTPQPPENSFNHRTPPPSPK